MYQHTTKLILLWHIKCSEDKNKNFTTKIKTRFFSVSITLPLKTIYSLINYWRISIKKMYFMCIIKPIYIYKNIKSLPIKKTPLKLITFLLHNVNNKK